MRKDWIPSGIAIALLLLVGMVANAQPYMRAIPSGSLGVTQSQITNTTANIANSDTILTLVVPSRRVTIKTSVTTAPAVYVDFAGGVATTADFQVDPGGTISYEGEPIQSIHYIGAAATGTISVLAY